MATDYVQGLFIIVNMLVSFYIVIYAFIFLTRTKNYPDRKPWELLFTGAFFFLISQIMGVSSIYGRETVFGLRTNLLRAILEFLYGSLVLMAFITQSHLILKSDMILITKKVMERKEDKVKENSDKKTKTEKDKVSENSYKKVTPDEELKFEIGKNELEKKMKEENFESEIKSEKELVEGDGKN